MYANYGRDEDFAELKKRGVNCTGKIVIVRYGKVARSSKVSVKVEMSSWVQPSGSGEKAMKTADNVSPLILKTSPRQRQEFYISSLNDLKFQQYSNQTLPA